MSTRRILACAVLSAVGAVTACTALIGVRDIQPPVDMDASLGDSAADDVAEATVDSMACLADGDLNNACYLCTDQSCCAQELACHDSSSCAAYEACAKACGNEGNTFAACTLQCAAQNPTGHAVFAPYLACTFFHCFAACGMSETDPCSACDQASCADLAYACDSDPACNILDACNLNCAAGSGMHGCMTVCANNAPAKTQQLYQPLLACENMYCTSVCGAPDAG